MALSRAYSFLTIKSVDADRRVLTGTATTPEPDRIGDIVEPRGAKFARAIPLLLFHDSTRPVGTVKLAPPTDDGITFEAKIPEIAEPGPLRDRVEEAWLSVKAGLVKGVSIGFRALDDGVELLRSGGVRFTKIEILELSLVSVPANSQATIATFKSIDAPYLAASGTGDGAKKPPSSGVTDSVTRTARKDARPMKKTITEQIAAFEASRVAKSARMTEIMTTAGDEGLTLDEAQSQEYDTLKTEVKSIDEHLVRLGDLEEANKHAAKPVAGTTAEDASAARGGHQTIRVTDRLEKGIEFARYAMCLMTAKGNTQQAFEIAKLRYPDQPRIHTVLKAAVAAGTTTDSAWAGSLVDYQNFAGDFIEFLRPQTILGKFGQNGVPSLRRVPFNVRIMGQTAGGSGYWVGQGKPKPLTKFAFEATTMRWAKVANIAVLSEELVRFSNPSAERLTRDALAAALVERMDIDFVDPDKAAVADVSPASITNGVAPLVTNGNDADSVRIDVKALFAPYIAANMSPTDGVWIMSPTTALGLSLMRNPLGQREFDTISMTGGTFQGLPVIVSNHVGAIGSPDTNIVILLNASDIFLADDGQVVIDASREASLEMLDSGLTQNGAAGTGASLVSLWQNNLLGLRAERFVNWAKRRAEAVVFMEGVAWGVTGSP